MSASPPASKRDPIARRQFIARASAGTIVVALGGALYTLSDQLTGQAKAETLPDGRPRLPPGQRVLQALKPMGGEPGNPRVTDFRLRIYGEVDRPYELDFAALRALAPVTAEADVHCVTGWSVLAARWQGVAIANLAKRAGLKPSARHVIFEAAHGYTANVRIDEALRANSMIVWELDGQPLRRAHGAPVRALVPDLYFWKSAKWIQAIRFSRRDEPGYWETRGYHNHADPWKNERYG